MATVSTLFGNTATAMLSISCSFSVYVQAIPPNATHVWPRRCRSSSKIHLPSCLRFRRSPPEQEWPSAPASRHPILPTGEA